MWIAELSRRAEVPVATIKYYLREGLLPPGESVGATRSRYDEAHVRRLGLIRALVESGLSLARVRGVLAAVDEESLELHDLLGAAHGALIPDDIAASAESRRRVDELVEQRGWLVSPAASDRALLAAALDALEKVGHHLDDDLLEVYAAAAQQVGDADVAHLPSADRASTVETTVLVTALGGPVLLALRRLAQQNASARRYGSSHFPAD
ncbi:transcriptional regulator, MerR family [Kribbella flavida DSM 17836]|uniref:Transcriptional regulator, MerR family n=1 Tax=Kribbella flavida (strain DSM 17836 / JCM 10339 / NBRC 14399) TaxID=479435 RepID=D2Q3Z8_KRIFD|nr:MerR family transcriptional regulator [Kribbella flavida]ADB36020.1 transcriptional regulator, MerR family [Kribbella flavida DSM 17836]